MWATPERYLRRSMLVKLAATIGDTEFPEEFLAVNTFSDANQKPDLEEHAIGEEVSGVVHEPLLANFFDEEE